MFPRKVETHQGEGFASLEAARAYAEGVQKSTVRYRAFLSNLKHLGIRGSYLDVGAGIGNLAAIITRNNSEVKVTALEISTAMATIGKDYIKSKGLQDQVEFIAGDVADKDSMCDLGKFDLIYSTYSLHHWKNPGNMIDNLMSRLKENGVLYVYDLRRVWWLYWIPIRNGFFNSIRAAYTRVEIKRMLKGVRPECYEIKYEFPFMQSIIIRKSS
jgi:2-polyprenyl-3-methyl-5-hydroxy-6-metoxy-1,4-benzoquinol methylase